MEKKYCRDGGEELAPDNKRGICPACHAKRQREIYGPRHRAIPENREAARIRSALWRQNNPEKYQQQLANKRKKK